MALSKKILDTYELWRTNAFFDEQTRNELSAELSEKEIEDRFWRDLEFGTGGLRGVMGAGTNRMNKYVVGAATQGIAEYIIGEGKDCMEKGVVIAVGNVGKQKT